MLMFSKFFAKIDVSTSSLISFSRFASKITPSNFDIHEIFVSLTICLNSGYREITSTISERHKISGISLSKRFAP